MCPQLEAGHPSRGGFALIGAGPPEVADQLNIENHTFITFTLLNIPKYHLPSLISLSRDLKLAALP